MTVTPRASWREVLAHQELFMNLVRRELRSKFKTTAFGWLWSLVNPLAQVLMFTIVASVIFKAKIDPGADGLNSFPIWMFCGFVVWNFFVTSTTAAMNSFVFNANLIQKASFPRSLLVLSVIAAQGVTSLIEFGVLLLIFVVMGAMPLLWVPMALVAIAPIVFFTIGLGLLLAVMNVYFRDTSHIMGIVFQLWFYATPIIYPLKMVHDAAIPEWFKKIYAQNPTVSSVTAVRDALYFQQMPNLLNVAVLWVIALTVLAVGWQVFRRLEPRLAEEL